uniref:Putative intron-encoded endonuclease aI7 n=1 Tax=Talaromyces marneffei PM1 TaxID=1077442 RepID=A0A093V4Y1_TALMA
MQYVQGQHQNDYPIQRITSPKAPDHGSTFLNIDDDTDSDKEFQSGTFALILPENSMVKVKVWFEDSVAKTIWIEGASPISYQPKGALPRRELYQNPTSINNNCIYFSCKPNGYSASNTPPQASESNEEHTLISLLYAIIAQLQRLLPQESCFTTPEFHEIKFESLYKSIKSAPAALQIIRAYLEHTTATSLLWIVDGLQTCRKI